MGLSLRYRGRLDNIVLVSYLCDELEDIARTMKWPSTTLNEDWSKPATAKLVNAGNIEGDLGLKGIAITPHPNSESLAMFFDRDGYIRSPMTMVFILDGTQNPETAWVSMKTQFAGADTHVWVIEILKYLKKRYLSNLEVSDESEYWDTGDRRKLEDKLAFLNGKLEQLSSAISSVRVGDVAALSAEEIASRIERIVLKNEQSGTEQNNGPED